MMAQLEITPPIQDRRSQPKERADSLPLNLVAVASEASPGGGEAAVRQPAPAVSFRIKAFGSNLRRIKYSRVAAHTVGCSAAWLRRRTGKASVRALTAGAVGMAPGGLSSLLQDLPAILTLLEREQCGGLDHKAIAAAIVAIRTADAVIVGPLSADDANAPGLIPHLADLACRAYRALRPPRELIIHPGFAQVARRFQFIQMSHHDARSLAAGAIDIGVLAHRLRQLQGDGGEFAITAFSGHGVLWADNRWWEIDPIGDENVDEARAGAAFCTAWVVARRFLGVSAAKALAYARSAALGTVRGS